VRQALAFPADALIKSREGTRFLVESLFERHRDTRAPDVAAEAVGVMLDAAFEPVDDDAFGPLVRMLDKPESGS
jgi:hypothetical protein